MLSDAMSKMFQNEIESSVVENPTLGDLLKLSASFSEAEIGATCGVSYDRLYVELNELISRYGEFATIKSVQNKENE